VFTGYMTHWGDAPISRHLWEPLAADEGEDVSCLATHPLTWARAHPLLTGKTPCARCVCCGNALLSPEGIVTSSCRPRASSGTSASFCQREDCGLEMPIWAKVLGSVTSCDLFAGTGPRGPGLLPLGQQLPATPLGAQSDFARLPLSLGGLTPSQSQKPGCIAQVPGRCDPNRADRRPSAPIDVSIIDNLLLLLIPPMLLSWRN
jgi:hypothetical protein